MNDELLIELKNIFLEDYDVLLNNDAVSLIGNNLINYYDILIDIENEVQNPT